MKETTLCYMEWNNQYLMLHRIKKENDENKNKWIGIGGKLEKDETVEECLKREVWEETGLTLVTFQYRGIIEFRSDLWPEERMHLFTSDHFVGELHPCDEGELAWIEKERVGRLHLWEGDRIFLRLLMRGEPFFQLELYYSGDHLRLAVLNGNAIVPETF